MTPWQTSLAIDGYKDQRKVQQDDQSWLAWHIAALSKTDNKKFPKLADMLAPRKKVTLIDEADIKARMAAYRERYNADGNDGSKVSG